MFTICTVLGFKDNNNNNNNNNNNSNNNKITNSCTKGILLNSL